MKIADLRALVGFGGTLRFEVQFGKSAESNHTVTVMPLPGNEKPVPGAEDAEAALTMPLFVEGTEAELDDAELGFLHELRRYQRARDRAKESRARVQALDEAARKTHANADEKEAAGKGKKAKTVAGDKPQTASPENAKPDKGCEAASEKAAETTTAPSPTDSETQAKVGVGKSLSLF